MPRTVLDPERWIVFLEDGPMLHCEAQRFDGLGEDPVGVRWSVFMTDGRFRGPIVRTERSAVGVYETLDAWWFARRLRTNP